MDEVDVTAKGILRLLSNLEIERRAWRNVNDREWLSEEEGKILIRHSSFPIQKRFRDVVADGSMLFLTEAEKSVLVWRDTFPSETDTALQEQPWGPQPTGGWAQKDGGARKK